MAGRLGAVGGLCPDRGGEAAAPARTGGGMEQVFGGRRFSVVREREKPNGEFAVAEGVEGRRRERGTDPRRAERRRRH